MEENNQFKISTIEGKEYNTISGLSILDSALSSNLFFEYSCKSGQCGTCKTTLLEGEIIEIQEQLGLDKNDRDNQFLSCCCEAASDIKIDAIDLIALQGIEAKILPARISSLDLLSENILQVKLRVPPTSKFIFLEGQYIDIIGEDAIKRSYSISSISSNKEIRLLIKKIENGEFSNYWFNKAKINDLLRIKGPKGTFFLRDLERPLFFLATGTGIAPIISMLEMMDANSAFRQTEKINLFWGNRVKQNFIWTPEFKNIEVGFYKITSRKEDSTKYDFGYVQDIALREADDLKKLSVYACGSNKMITSAKKDFIKAGLNEREFFSDAFVQSF